MAWQTLGRVHVPRGDQHWARGYASFPTAYARPDGSIRVCFTSLDDQQQGRTGWLEVDGDDPTRVLRLGEAPLFELGEMGHFDENGANVFSTVEWQGRRLFYYQGWQRTTRAPYLIFTGVALPLDGDEDRLQRLQATPVLDRRADEATMRAAPWVIADGDRLRMWYVSCVRWQIVQGAPRYHVEIRTTTSDDGIRWSNDSVVCLVPQGHEYAVGRPCVRKTGRGYEMWFSVRSSARPYHLAHAHSEDGVHWVRSGPEVALPQASASRTAWDAEMVCYPCVIEHAGHVYLFYNGNQHGRTGFGVARWFDGTR